MGTEEQEQQEIEYAQGWRPSNGDKIAGVVTDIAATDLGQGVYPVVTVKTESGEEVAVHAFHNVLRKELARRRPKVGDELEITYAGKVNKGGYQDKGYHVYRVRSANEPVGYNWDQDLPTEERSATDDVPIQASPVPGPKPAEEVLAAHNVPEIPEVPDDDLPF